MGQPLRRRGPRRGTIRTDDGQNSDELAQASVPIVENPVVAREIYHQVEIGYEVPDKFFRAVAEILAYVYRLKGKTAEPSASTES